MEFTVVRMPKIIFGPGTRMKVGEEAAARGRKALVVCGRGSVRREGYLEQVRSSLAESGVEGVVMEGVEPEPTVEMVERGRAELQRSGCDIVIGLGGGSVMDVAKAIGGLAGTRESAAAFVAGPEPPRPGLPVICLPTTSGTGAEVTRNAVITDPARRVKASIRGDSLMPAVAIVDPELTLSLPPEPTAASGLDAFVQALEAFVSRGASIITDDWSLRALAAIAGSLRRAWRNGGDRQAREQMSLGSLLAGMALGSARLGLVHGMAHPLGLLYHVPHGLVCAVLLPEVVRFNAAVAADKYGAAARAMGAGRTVDDLLDWIAELYGEMGVPSRFEQLKEDDFEIIVKQTLASGSTRANPRPVTESDVTEILRRLM